MNLLQWMKSTKRATVKELLYETKLLTLRSQGETFLLLDVEKVESDEESTKKIYQERIKVPSPAAPLQHIGD